MENLTKSEILEKLGMSQAEMARMFGIKPAAVYQWPDDHPLPELREMQLRHELHPELFEEQAKSTEAA